MCVDMCADHFAGTPGLVNWMRPTKIQELLPTMRQAEATAAAN